MSLGSTAAKNVVLRGTYGTSRSSLAPATIDVRLYVGDPAGAGVEMTGGGYAPVTLANSDANMGVPTTGLLTPATVTYATSTGAWSGGTPPDHWAITDGAGVIYDTGVVSANPGVSVAGQDVLLTLTVDPG